MILHELMQFDTLRIIWWALLGFLLIGFALTDGFDMGVGVLLPFIGKNDVERRIAINTIGPVWEGNQVWFILGGGTIFAAWPPLYAVSFSGFYLAMFLALAALILRPVAFKYRSKRESKIWRSSWDWALFVGSLVPALVFGIAIGNVLQGVPFHLTDDLRAIYEGSFLGLLNPFALSVGLTSVAMVVMHGAAWLGVKAEGVIAQRAAQCGEKAALVVIALYALNGLWLAFMVEGFALVDPHVPNGPSNPLLSEVTQTSSWLLAYAERPWIAIAPVLGFAGAIMANRGLKARREISTLLASKLSIIGMISSVGLTIFPFVLPSNIDPKSSLSIWDSSSSHLTLFVMLISTAIFMPLILCYTAWVYKVLWGKVTEDDITKPGSTHY
ncbi:cytochrome d ubiquinol oxidase subunit II [Granulosicoccus antarcticus]|uniref:Cytochrome bd-II ubiquinol oxidase subunit 2 n=1 Tax=Granulosicoccus antarcticus IMCC3135 TaxID=1192854 RepID=A0A2Z2P1S5_9GAMM|nr:cytochrome d ubiquinol oxidase subunit II [Granulosicoccus antarcticus]ASJ75230.1 Cytochrome bd-II ubiquinol oxidase subunit 2 [Granulosicoccus antarcticus IMCC3135]